MTEGDVREIVAAAIDSPYSEIADHFRSLCRAVDALQKQITETEKDHRKLRWLFDDSEDEVKPNPKKPTKTKASAKKMEIPYRYLESRPENVAKYAMQMEAADRLTRTGATGKQIKQNNGPARQTTVAARTATAGTRGTPGVHRPLSQAEADAMRARDAKRAAPDFMLKNKQATDAYRSKAGMPSLAVEKQILLDAAEAAAASGEWANWLHSCKKATAHYLAMPETLKFLRS